MRMTYYSATWTGRPYEAGVFSHVDLGTRPWTSTIVWRRYRDQVPGDMSQRYGFLLGYDSLRDQSGLFLFWRFRTYHVQSIWREHVLDVGMAVLQRIHPR